MPGRSMKRATEITWRGARQPMLSIVWGQPGEVAECIAFLASDSSRFCHRVSVTIRGGRDMRPCVPDRTKLVHSELEELELCVIYIKLKCIFLHF